MLWNLRFSAIIDHVSLARRQRGFERDEKDELVGLVQSDSVIERKIKGRLKAEENAICEDKGDQDAQAGENRFPLYSLYRTFLIL